MVWSGSEVHGSTWWNVQDAHLLHGLPAPWEETEVKALDITETIPFHLSKGKPAHANRFIRNYSTPNPMLGHLRHVPRKEHLIIAEILSVGWVAVIFKIFFCAFICFPIINVFKFCNHTKMLLEEKSILPKCWLEERYAQKWIFTVFINLLLKMCIFFQILGEKLDFHLSEHWQVPRCSVVWYSKYKLCSVTGLPSNHDRGLAL